MSRGNWITTASGKAFYPFDPKPEDIEPWDIAHALSMLCRYGGHCRYFYSVAEHSVLASHYVPKEDALAALLHDASEAYLVDIPRPIKRLLPEYRELEKRIEAVIAQRFGYSYPYSNAIKEVDDWLLRVESWQLMPPLPVFTEDEDVYPRLRIDDRRIDVNCWSAETAKQEFMLRFVELTRNE